MQCYVKTAVLGLGLQYAAIWINDESAFEHHPAKDYASSRERHYTACGPVWKESQLSSPAKRNKGAGWRGDNARILEDICPVRDSRPDCVAFSILSKRQ